MIIIEGFDCGNFDRLIFIHQLFLLDSSKIDQTSTHAVISNFISPIPRKSWGKIIAIRRKEYFREYFEPKCVTSI